jgi:hypothetical protein
VITRERLAAFGGSVDDATDEEFHQYLTLDAGIAVARARLRWCDDAIKMINRRRKAKKPRAGGKRSKA